MTHRLLLLPLIIGLAIAAPAFAEDARNERPMESGTVETTELDARAEADTRRRQPALALRAGTYAQHFFHPGLRFTLRYRFNAHARTLRDANAGRRGELFVGPHLGIANRAGVHTNYMMGAEFGYRMLTPTRSRFHEFSFAQSYIAQSEITEYSVDLSTGEQTPTRDLRSLIVPALRYTFGREPDRKVGWYISGGLGRALSPQLDSAAYYDVELGIQFALGGRRQGGER